MRLVMSIVALALLTGLMLASPVEAATGSVALPEPGTLGLLTLGIAGLVIGRQASRKPPHD